MEYEISVKTGDRLGAGTDANVFVILHGDGASSDEIQLDASFCNDFERGQTDVYYINNQKVKFAFAFFNIFQRAWFGCQLGHYIELCCKIDALIDIQ